MARTKKRFRWLKFLLEVCILAALAAALFIGAKLVKMKNEPLVKAQLVTNDNIPADELDRMKNYTDIALFGVDSRNGELEAGTNSDTIMICSINNQTHEVKLVSVYRDTYLDLTDGTYSKCNAAYAIGGEEQAVSMLNKNLDLQIGSYVTVGFEALVEVVDMFGGVDINLTEGELHWLNGYLVELRDVLGRECEDVPGPGLQHLNGMQALAYSRIRFIGLDYERTERQRLVLQQVLENAKGSDIFAWNSLIDAVLPKVSTNLSMFDLLKIASGIGSFSVGETQGFPFDKTTKDISAGDCVVAVNLAANVSELHRFLYGSEGYVPSATVQEISDAISAETGIY